jgi:hypothetical protein
VGLEFFGHAQSSQRADFCVRLSSLLPPQLRKSVAVLAPEAAYHDFSISNGRTRLTFRQNARHTSDLLGVVTSMLIYQHLDGTWNTRTEVHGVVLVHGALVLQ